VYLNLSMNLGEGLDRALTGDLTAEQLLEFDGTDPDKARRRDRAVCDTMLCPSRVVTFSVVCAADCAGRERRHI
jgi:hypothetical protein